MFFRSRLAILLSVSFLSVSAHVALAEISIGGTFNSPGFDDQPTTTIENKLIEMIDLAAPRSSIQMSMYTFKRMPITLALLRAQSRGVRIELILDGKNKELEDKKGSPVHVLLKGTSDLAPLRCGTHSCVTFCGGILGGSCRGIVNNHNKFFLFSELQDGRKNVVVLSSANFEEGMFHMYNDLLVLAGDTALFEGVQNYFNGLRNPFAKVPLQIRGQSAVIYTFPNQKYDPTLEILKQVQCHLPDSKIRITQSRFTDERLAIAKELLKLSQLGCQIQVITREEPLMQSPGLKVKATLRSLMQILPYKGHSKKAKNSNHSKTIAIDASFQGSAQKVQMVLTGSHNLNTNSLKNNDELQIQIIHPAVYKAYSHFFDQMLEEAQSVGYLGPF